MISPEKTKHWCNSIPRRQGFICCVVLSILNVETLRHKAYSFESFTVLTYLECSFHIHSWILYCRSNVQNGIMFFSKFDVFLVSMVFQLLEDSRLEPQKVTHFGKENHLQYLHIWVPYLYMRVEQKVHERGFLCVSLWVCSEQSRLKFVSEMAKVFFFLAKVLAKVHVYMSNFAL